MAIDIKGLLSNPMAAYKSASQPGGLLAPATSMNGFLGDPRLNIGLAIAQGQPLGKAIMGGALQAKQIQDSLEPEKDTVRVSKIKGLMTRLQSTDPGLNDTEALNKATDIVDGNLKMEFNSNSKTFSTFDPVTQDIETFGGPLASQTYNSEVAPTSGSTPLVTNDADTRTEGQKRRGIRNEMAVEPYLGPTDFTPKQLEKHKTRISDIDEGLIELKRSIDKTDDIFGIGNKFRRGAGNIAALTPEPIDKYLINPDVEQATQEYKLVKEKLVKSLTDNPKFPVKEVERLLEIFPSETAWLQDPQQAKIKLITLYNGLQTMSDNAKTALSGKTVISDPLEIPRDPTEQDPVINELVNKYRDNL